MGDRGGRDEGSTYDGTSVGSWAWTMRGQTVLIGDRAGNGLNVNFGVGFGGLTYDSGYARASSPTGLALAGGISYDARITRFCAFSPEFFYTWHQVPNGAQTPPPPTWQQESMHTTGTFLFSLASSP